jgi:chemotaxis signal transduction protein
VSKINFDIDVNLFKNSHFIMETAKYLIFKINQKKYAIKTSSVVDIIENSRTYTKGQNQKCGVRFNGKPVPVLDLKSVGSDANSDKHFNSILIIETKLGFTKDLIGVGLDSILEVTTHEALLAYNFISASNITINNQAEQQINYKGEKVTLFNLDNAYIKRIVEEAIKNHHSLIIN